MHGMYSAQGWPNGALSKPKFGWTDCLNREKQWKLRPHMTGGIDIKTLKKLCFLTFCATKQHNLNSVIL